MKKKREWGLLQSVAVPLLLAVVACVWLVISLYGGPAIYHGGDELGPLSLWPDRYRAAWTRPLPVEPRIVAKDGDLLLGDAASERRLNRAADEVDPSVTPGGDRLLFSSNRISGFAESDFVEDSSRGGFDLYVAPRDGSGFGDPVLLPAPLSTVFQERSPSLALLPDGSARLLFTSNRLHGVATDYDLFLAMRGRDGAWHPPVLLDVLSSAADERGATIHPEGDAIVFSRPEARGIEYYESYRRADGTWSDPVRLRALRHPDNGPVVRFDEGGNALLFARGDDWYRSRLRILRAIPDGGTPWGAWILLALALLLLLLRTLASRWTGLEVLYRCLLVSILIHLLLWWWLEDRGLEAPEPSDAGPPASEIAPIELDPELFARAREPEARQRAHGEEVSMPELAVSAVRPVTEVAARATERAALPSEVVETTPTERTSEPLAAREREVSATEPLPEPSRRETEIDAREFELANDPGRDVLPVDRASEEALRTPAPRESRSEEAAVALAKRSARNESPALETAASSPSLARPANATHPDPSEAVTREQVTVASLDLPSREAPRTGSAPVLAEATEPSEESPAERDAPLAARAGERSASETAPTPRPTRVRPGPTPADRPAAELARIAGRVNPVTPGGAVAPGARARPIEPDRAATAGSAPVLAAAETESTPLTEANFEPTPARTGGRAIVADAAIRAGSARTTPERTVPGANVPGAGAIARGGAPTPTVGRERESVPALTPGSSTRGRAPSSGRGSESSALADATAAHDETSTEERDFSRLAPLEAGAGPELAKITEAATSAPKVERRVRGTTAALEPTDSLAGTASRSRTQPTRPTATARPAIEPGRRSTTEPALPTPRRPRVATPAAAELARLEHEGRSALRGAATREESIEELSLDRLPAPRGGPARTNETAPRARTEEVAARRLPAPSAELPRIGSTLTDDAPTLVARAVETSEEWVPWVSARRGPEKAEALRRGGGSEETEAAVKAGLAYLASKQRDHGGWGNPRRRHEKYGETSVGRSALSLLAFLGAGHAPETATEYSALTSRAIDYLLASQHARTGHFGSRTSSYSHAISTYALGEAVLMGSRDPRIARALERGIEQILRHQELDGNHPEHYGGWSYYYPDGHRFDEYPRVSITVWQLIALETALLAGIEIPEARIAAGKRWILAQWSDRLEMFYYTRKPDWVRRRFPTLPGSTPAAAFILQVLGHDDEDERLIDALASVSDRPPRGWTESSTERFLERGEGNTYFWYYGTLALFLRGGEDWDRWNEALKETLLPSQARDGSWKPIDPYSDYAGDTQGDRIYTTAINVLTLEVYYRYLTPFQQKVAKDR